MLVPIRSLIVTSMLALLPAAGTAQLIGIGSADACPPVTNTAITLCTGTFVPVVLTTTIRSSSGPLSRSDAVVLGDVKVGDSIVIKRGTAVQFSVDAIPAGWQSA